MTFEQYKIIQETYLDFYPDENLDIYIPCAALQRAFDSEALNLPVNKEDLVKIKESSSAMRITVYYPEITVTNEHGLSHTITDVYVEADFPVFNIYLGRTSYTQDEINSGYIHSHVPPNNFDQLQNFCTGNSQTAVNQLEWKIKQASKENLSAEAFSLLIQSYIIEIERMIKTESLEGGPYIKMSNIEKHTNSQPLFITPTKGSYLIPKLVDFIDYYCSLRLDNFYYDGKCWQMEGTDADFINRVTTVAKSYKPIKNQRSFFQNAYLINGLYYTESHKKRRLRCHLTNWAFKGEYKPLKILSDSTEGTPIRIVQSNYLDIIYGTLLHIINSAYANISKHRDSFYSRAYQIKTQFFKTMRS